ncbi:hypothetical protein F5Y16DRAFT_79066 [Xylariaceae sp. FL0255]|nr:hypothetical protein F5Y16DRAFT_79066 [Xylariaceae sp. FL0255]
MSLQAIHNVVLLFRDPASYNPSPYTFHSNPNVTAISAELAYSDDIIGNLTTLSTNYVAPHDGTLQGLLYVPDSPPAGPCKEVVGDIIPPNVTRQANFPTTDYKLIALAPWTSINCTRSFMDSASTDPIHALLVYRPYDDDGQPPKAESELWELDDSGAWKSNVRFPVYAVSSGSGKRMMQQLSLYSGDISTIPNMDEINRTYTLEPDSSVRIWAELSVKIGSSPLSLWELILIIIAVLLVVIAGTSICMQYTQRRRRALLRYRVISGEINLETLGIKRMVVPLSHINTFPLFTYSYSPPISSSVPSTHPPNIESRSQDPIIIEDPLDFQPMCSICLEDFESNVSLIRELPCGHIFHPECIDEYLSELSSLCPCCKSSMLPLGHCPDITNSMVRRELNTRKLRSQSRSFREVGSEWRLFFSLASHGMKKSKTQELDSLEPATSIPLQVRAPVNRTVTATKTRERMEQLVPPIDEVNTDEGRSPWRRFTIKLFPGFG